MVCTASLSPLCRQAHMIQPLSDVFSTTPNVQTNTFAQRLSRVQSPINQSSAVKPTPIAAKGLPLKQQIKSPAPAVAGGASQDSGYYGSQDVFSQSVRPEDSVFVAAQDQDTQRVEMHPLQEEETEQASDRALRFVPETGTPLSLEAHQTRVSASVAPSATAINKQKVDELSERDDARDDVMENVSSSPIRGQQSPTRVPAQEQTRVEIEEQDAGQSVPSVEGSDEVRSNSDGSSPIRPVVRKSSLNFASLPAREPLAAGKSSGARTSRLSQLDQNRKSYYSRPIGEKSFGHQGRRESGGEEEGDMDVDEPQLGKAIDEKVKSALNHNKTYTQRLQDQINMLGKSKASGSRPSKSIHNSTTLQQSLAVTHHTDEPKSPQPKQFEPTKTTPGAFPQDEDEDDWIESPPQPAPVVTTIQSPRPVLPKSHSADVMEGLHRGTRIGTSGFESEAMDRVGQATSPVRPATAYAANPTVSSPGKSSSASAASASQEIEKQTHLLTKAISVPNPSTTAATDQHEPQTPSKSSGRSFRDSPLKQVKNKLSSILKSSKGLLASSAAISAEGKTSILSPSTSRIGLHLAQSTESVIPKLSSVAKKHPASGIADTDDNKTLPVSKRTRASIEKEKEEKRLEKEAKRMEGQMGKLEKAREQEREKARNFSKEQERIAAMERQMAAKKEEEKQVVKATPKPTRSSPRKVQRPAETTAKVGDQDIDMIDAPSMAPPPSIPRSVGPSSAVRPKEIKRPMRPVRETQTKAKQAPTLIRVNTGSQHSQYHTAAGSLATTALESTAAPTPQQSTASKASKATLQTKSSSQSLKSAPSAARPKTADLASKKKEQEEKEAQRRRDAKAEMDKKRAAAQEEQRKQEQRRQEAERQKQRDREQAASYADTNKSAHQRQAMIEKAKQTRAPPPAVRSQPNGPPDSIASTTQDKPGQSKAEAQASRPASRLDNSHAQPHDDPNRPNMTKSAGVKRALVPDAKEDMQGKRAPSRAGTSYQVKDSKRRRTSEMNDELDEDHPPNIKGPPVRPSAGFKKVSCKIA